MMHMGGVGVLKRKENQQGPEGWKSKVLAGAVVTGSSGDAGMDRGSGDIEN